MICGTADGLLDHLLCYKWSCAIVNRNKIHTFGNGVHSFHNGMNTGFAAGNDQGDLIKASLLA